MDNKPGEFVKTEIPILERVLLDWWRRLAVHHDANDVPVFDKGKSGPKDTRPPGIVFGLDEKLRFSLSDLFDLEHNGFSVNEKPRLPRGR